MRLVELGSGTAAKSRLLLSALADAGTLRRYVPVDVTEGMIRATGAALAAEYAGLEVHGIVGDFERHLGELPAPAGRRIVEMLGGTIGNFRPGARRRFLRAAGRLLGVDGGRLRRLRGSHRRVQPQRPARRQPRARRRLRARALRPRRVLRPRA
jgi:L-histidine N-alpha-methyltransferase